ncbi:MULTISPECIES: hypothetical protein [Cyanophyceae]|uniref:hypothetical protein n=1 Tax=Cyanophyceae TaxID=3028117 RepID=UPI001685478B|nr:hypothetical protein [Trichocoleus sp. FACHB-40]MBD2006556.1 hypothetical protein [Trichocoleus sp. FACHB-40]
MPNNNSQEYENLTREILNDDRICPYLDLNRIEAEKCSFPGKKTGANWEVDAFGYDLDGELVLIESGLTQLLEESTKELLNKSAQPHEQC